MLWIGISAVSRAVPYAPPDHSRTDLVLNASWKFLRADAPGASNVVFDDSLWTNVSLPHTWNNLDGQDGGTNYYRGVGWYRRYLDVDASLTGRQFFLKFDAASLVADAYVNGTFVGQHKGGFSAFTYDVTPQLNVGTGNVIAVKVNNAFDSGMPPLSADFTFFGGLYRDVHLLALDTLHVSPLDFGSPGIYLGQTNVSATSASLRVTTKLRNDGPAARTSIVQSVIVDAASNIVATLASTQVVNAATGADIVQNAVISNPHLWNGRADPYLYCVYTEIREGSNVVDLVRQPLGFRFFSVSPSAGFLLNGQYLDLRGANIHQDRLNKGWAISDADRQEDVALLLEMGATAIRLAHYPQADKTFELCDQSGLVVWTEIPFVNSASATAAFTNNARQQLTEMIRQNYNHPAVCFWGVYNEVFLAAGPDPRPLANNLHQLARAEDPSRPTTAASCCVADGDAINGYTDVIAFNKYYGWYTGAYGDFSGWADGFHATYPGRAFGISEYGVGASLVQHRENPPGPASDPNSVITPHYEEYQNLYHESHWLQMKARPFIWSKLIWNLFDFASDGRNEGDAPGRNDKGLVTFDRQTRKDSFYWYQSQWTTSLVTHITSRRFTPRITNAMEVKVYSNGDAVDLLINGVSQGVVTNTNGIFKWPGRVLVDGTNLLAAVGTKGTAATTDSVVCVISKAVNAGGYASGRFAADLNFSGGTASTSTNLVDTSAVTNPAPQDVYQSERYGNFTYTLGGLIPNSNYTVRLHFAEYYWSSAGQRVFNVLINGAQVLTNFDIVAAAGAPLKAIVREFTAPANGSGQMAVQYVTVTDNAKASAIELLGIPVLAVNIRSPAGGIAFTASTGTVLELEAAISEGGFPQPTNAWSQVSGPAGVAFGNTNALATSVSFSQAGIYGLRITSNNGQTQAVANVTVVVGDGGDLLGAGLAAHWKFDETAGTTATDSSSNGLDAAASSAGLWTTNGLLAGAVHFAGTATNNVNAQHPAGLQNLFSTGGTLSAYFNTATLGGGSLGRLLDKNDGGWKLFNQNSFINGQMALQFEQMFTNTTAYTTAARKWITPYTVQTAAWTHVAVSYNSGSSTNIPTIYFNGVATTLIDVSSPVPGPADLRNDDATNDLFIGNRADTARAFGGRIDDVRLYRRPLNAVEISALLALPNANYAPAAYAGPDKTTIPGVAVLLGGSITDDGKPAPPGAVSSEWARASGPGVLTIGDATITNPVVAIDVPGTNVLKLTADDGQARVSDEALMYVLGYEDWMLSLGLSGTNALPDADPDGDRMSNADEFECGTDATNGASFLRHVDLDIEGNGLRVRWTAVGGKRYIVQTDTGAGYSGSFTDASPVVVVPMPGESTTNVFDPGALTNGPARFYRVRLAP